VCDNPTNLDQSSLEKTIMAKRKTTLKKSWVKGLLEWNEVLNNTRTGLHGDHTLHVTVTTTQADCGQGFHLSLYQVVNGNLSGFERRNAVSRVYFTYDESTSAAVRLNRLGFRPNTILRMPMYGTENVLSQATSYYRELYDIAEPQPLTTFVLNAANFPQASGGESKEDGQPAPQVNRAPRGAWGQQTTIAEKMKSASSA
jgi:hypothetical protein